MTRKQRSKIKKKMLGSSLLSVYPKYIGGIIMVQVVSMIITSAIGYLIAHYIVQAIDNMRKKK